MKAKLIIIFTVVVCIGIILTGYLFHSIYGRANIDKGSLTVPAAPIISTTSVQQITYLVSPEDPTKYCNGEDMDSIGYQKTITHQESTSTPLANPSKLEIIKTVLNAATTGMCHDALNQADIREDNGVVYIPPFDGWAGISITMCSCQPQVEVNLLQIPDITKVVWSADNGVSSLPSKDNIISLETPLPGQTISSPLTIKGQARGSWFFEASFPVILVDWDGQIIAQGSARAKGDWLTTEFVPFEANLNFVIDKKIYSNKGSLILKKDNPSGISGKADSLEIPVVFSVDKE